MRGLRGNVGYVGCVGQFFTWVAWVTWVKIFFTWVNILRGLRGSNIFLRGSKKILIGFHDIGFQYISCSLNPNSEYVKSHPISCSFTFT